MSKTWKWVLGIILGLVVLAGVGIVVASFFGYGHMPFRGGPAFFGRPMMDGYGFSNRGPIDEFRHPMMGGRGFGGYGGYGSVGLPFFFLGELLRLVFPLAVVGLVAYFSYRAGKQAGMKAVQVAPAPEPKETE